MKNIHNLPDDIVLELNETLDFFQGVSVTYEYGEFKVLPAIGIKAHYPPDYKDYGYYKEKIEVN